MLSSGPSQVSATRSQPGALGSESGGQKITHTRLRLFQWALEEPRLAERRVRAPAGLPGGSRVLGFRRRAPRLGRCRPRKSGLPPSAPARFRGKSELRAPARSEAPSPGPTASGKAGPEQRLLIAPARPGKGPGQGKGPGAARAHLGPQPVAELAALADAQLPLLLGLRRLARRGAQPGPEAAARRVAPGRRRDCGTRGAAALAARGRLHGARRRVQAATTSAAGTRVRSARRRGWGRRRDGPTAQAPQVEVRRRQGAGGVRECAARVAGGRDSGPAAAAALRPRGQVRAAEPAPRPRRRSPRPEAGGEGGIRPGLKPGGSGVWAGLPRKPGRNPGRAC